MYNDLDPLQYVLLSNSVQLPRSQNENDDQRHRFHGLGRLTGHRASGAEQQNPVPTSWEILRNTTLW